MFPEFPYLTESEVVVHEDRGTVEVPQDWIIDLAEYKIRVDAVEKTWKEVYK